MDEWDSRVEIWAIQLLCKVNFQKNYVCSVRTKCVGRTLSNCERYGNSPHSDVVIDWLCVDDREVDVDAIPRRYPDCPHAVLEVRILSWVPGRINCAIHGCYVPTAESWKEGRESERLMENEKPTLNLLQVINFFSLSFMVVWPLTLATAAWY